MGLTLALCCVLKTTFPPLPLDCYHGHRSVEVSWVERPSLWTETRGLAVPTQAVSEDVGI